MPNKCPQCGATLPAGALDGLCPACLLKQGAETGPPPESVPFQPPSLEEVARLFPQLEILAFIGKGGMGAVYKARQPALDRLVALKILPPQAAAGAGFAERFNREARALARLNHPNIVAVHEFGQAGNLPFFIMEFVDGLTLRQLEQSARLAPDEALRIVPQICEALQYAHDEGIVHRDIKPENILIDKKGRVKIADFGIAKIIAPQPGGADLPVSPEFASAPPPGPTGVIGTPHYMAPEQVETPQKVDHRADIFSLGVVFYEMLTGQLPLGRFAPPSRKVQIDARLDEVVLRALEREPELRYQHAAEVKTEIDTITSTPSGATPSGEHMRPRMSQPAPPPAGSVHSASFKRLSFARALSVLVSFACAGFLIAAVNIALSPKIYVARMRFLVDQSNHGGDPHFLQSQATLVASDPVLLRAAAVFPAWIKKQWSEQAGVSRLTDEAIAGHLRSALSVAVLPGSDSLDIRASAKSYYEAAVIATQASYAFRGLDDGVRRTLLDEEPAYEIAPRPVGKLLVGAGLGLLLGLVVVVALGGRRSLTRSPVKDGGSPPPSTTAPAESRRLFAWLALGSFILALLGWAVLMRFDPTHGSALACAGVGLTLALVFGIISWHDRIGRVVATAILSLTAMAAIALIIGYLINPYDLRRSRDSEATGQAPAPAGTWSPNLAPGERPDLWKFQTEVEGLMNAHNYKEALPRLQWFSDQGKYEFGYGALPDFVLSNWVWMGSLYPKAITTLKEIRDGDTSECAAGRCPPVLFTEVLTINRALGDTEASRNLCKLLADNNPQFAQKVYARATDFLLGLGEYELCSRFMGDPQVRLDAAIDEFRKTAPNVVPPGQPKIGSFQAPLPTQLPPPSNIPTPFGPSSLVLSNKPMMPQMPSVHLFTNFKFDSTVRNIVEILIGTGHKADAEKIAAQAIAVLDDPWLHSAITDAEARIASRAK